MFFFIKFDYITLIDYDLDINRYYDINKHLLFTNIEYCQSLIFSQVIK